MPFPAAQMAAARFRELPVSPRPIFPSNCETSARACERTPDDVAAYYANLEAPFLPLASPDPALVKKGELLAETGDAVKGIPACAVCHGAGGAGQPPTIPYLAGQYANYTAFQLQMWKRGFRKNSPGVMGLFAKKLDAQEIAAVAAYYQQLRSSAQTEGQPRN
jgi:cytochrome c553